MILLIFLVHIGHPMASEPAYGKAGDKCG